MQGTVIPLDGHVTRLSTDPRVTMLLLPLPSSQRVTDAGDKPKPAVKPAPRPTLKNNSGKRKTRAERICPEEIRNYTTRVAARQICWNTIWRMAANLAPVGNRRSAPVACTCAPAVTRLGTQQWCAERPKRVDRSAHWASKEISKGYFGRLRWGKGGIRGSILRRCLTGSLHLRKRDGHGDGWDAKRWQSNCFHWCCRGAGQRSHSGAATSN